VGHHWRKMSDESKWNIRLILDFRESADSSVEHHPNQDSLAECLIIE
jgi:hypothetical protein